MAIDMAKIQQQKAKLSQELSRGGGQSAKFWRPSDGANVVRIMPPWTDEGSLAGQFWREVGQHWGVSSDQKGPVLCPKATEDLDGDCPICDFVEELRKDKTNVQAQETAKEIRAKKAYLLNIVDTDDPVYNAKDVAEYKKARPDRDVPFEAGSPKIQVYACPKTIFDQILNTIMQNNLDITDLDKGHDITINRSGKGLTTRYTVTPQISATSADVSMDDELPALDQIGYLMDFAGMTELLTTGVGGDYVALLPSGSAHSAAASTPEDPAGFDAGDLADEMLSELNG